MIIEEKDSHNLHFSLSLSVLFNFSKFFEVTCIYHIHTQVGGYDTSGNNITDIPVNITSDICQPQVLNVLCKHTFPWHIKNFCGMLIIMVIKSVSSDF